MASQQPSKRPPSPNLIPNPFVKKRNLQWTIDLHPQDHIDEDDDLQRQHRARDESQPAKAPLPSAAAIESGATIITDHLAHFAADISSHVLQSPPLRPPLSISSFTTLYKDNEGSPRGAHFVIHQHDHPVAGTHYDLRLQINGSSSASWAIMYGLPGDPNSKRLNRNATETRIHSLWVSTAVPLNSNTEGRDEAKRGIMQNHLIETASPHTGSLLIWDTGTYSVLPRRSKHAPREDPSLQQHSPERSTSPGATPATQQALLEQAFHNRKIRLRLHGSKLPDPYVLNLRLTKSEDASGRAKSLRTPRSRRRGRTKDTTPQRRQKQQQQQPETSDSEEGNDKDDTAAVEAGPDGGDDDAHVVPPREEADPAADVSALERELRELEDEQVRRSNAYPGAHNSIGSVHQRKWYLSLDRRACGFIERRRDGKTVWQRDEAASTSDDGEATGKVDDAEMESECQPGRLSFPFYVRGPEYERSVVTGRRGEDILRDEGVTNFIPRKGWTAVLN
ncbi:Protein STB2 [Purpureocillium lavendulum]|uniref:Protein STB2 n=1 Tax=Purpureocillium lavendulum TaxID=1247861 RepID=A0AB34FVT1_9HYPO|nr:Protein STB2 [Purpureocillium lavendulum]